MRPLYLITLLALGCAPAGPAPERCALINYMRDSGRPVPPEASLGPRVTVERLAGALPAISWRWDPETDILSGTFRSSGSSRLDGTIELTDAEGAIAVLDVADGAQDSPKPYRRRLDGNPLCIAHGDAMGCGTVGESQPRLIRNPGLTTGDLHKRR